MKVKKTKRRAKRRPIPENIGNSVCGVWHYVIAMALIMQTQFEVTGTVQKAKNAPLPNNMQPAAVKTDRPGVLSVRFDISKLNEMSGSYGFASGKLIGNAVPSELLEGMTISDGDSRATLEGREYVCVVAISADSINTLRDKILPRILADKELNSYSAAPLTNIEDFLTEPLVSDGIVRNGKIIGPGGWCAKGFEDAWANAKKAEAAKAEKEKEQEREKEQKRAEALAKEQNSKTFTAVNPRLSSNYPLDKLLRVFVFTNGSGQEVLSCPVACGTLEDTAGAYLKDILKSAQTDIIARSDIGETLMQSGAFPENAWEKMAEIDPNTAISAKTGAVKTCVRTFHNPNTGEKGAAVLFYNKS